MKSTWCVWQRKFSKVCKYVLHTYVTLDNHIKANMVFVNIFRSKSNSDMSGCLPKYFIIFLGLLSLVIPSRAFSSEESEVFSFPNLFNLNSPVHPDVEGLFNIYLLNFRKFRQNLLRISFAFRKIWRLGNLLLKFPDL